MNCNVCTSISNNTSYYSVHERGALIQFVVEAVLRPVRMEGSESSDICADSSGDTGDLLHIRVKGQLL